MIIYCTAVPTPYHCVAIPLLLHQHYWYHMLANIRHSWILKEDSITTRTWTTYFNAAVFPIWHTLPHSPHIFLENFKVFTTMWLRILYFWNITWCQWVNGSQILRQHNVLNLQELPTMLRTNCSTEVMLYLKKSSLYSCSLTCKFLWLL